MGFTTRLIDSPERLEVFIAQLKSSGLPHKDLDFKNHILVGYYDGEELVGTGGLEVYGEYALLRSLSVKLGVRGKSLGSSITEDLIAQARRKGLKAIYLLTETAHGYFLSKGFRDIARTDVPEPVKASSEFSEVCSTSAACMFYALA